MPMPTTIAARPSSTRGITPGPWRISSTLWRYSRTMGFYLELLKQPMIQTPPTCHDTSKAHKRLMHVVAFIEPGTHAAELVQQTDSLFDEVADSAQTAAVLGVAAGDVGRDPAGAEFVAMRLAVVAAVGQERLRPTQRRADFAANGRYGIHHRDQLGHVVTVGPGQRADQRHAPGVGQQGRLGTRFAAIHGAGSRFFPQIG